jgi:hypothetical protein
LDPVKNGVVSQGAYDRPLDDVKRRVAWISWLKFVEKVIYGERRRVVVEEEAGFILRLN